MVKIKDGCRRPYLSMDRNHFRACTTILLGEHLRQVSKKSDQWSRRRWDNELVTVLSKVQIVVLKMAAVRPYLLTDQNRFRVYTSRHRGIHMQGFGEIPPWFRRRCDNGVQYNAMIAQSARSCPGRRTVKGYAT